MNEYLYSKRMTEMAKVENQFISIPKKKLKEIMEIAENENEKKKL